jgi:hypothetical protein
LGSFVVFATQDDGGGGSDRAEYDAVATFDRKLANELEPFGLAAYF